ncbi:MAG: cupredoxin domain-containing protein, partial [Patescibacteria group bacterium]
FLPCGFTQAMQLFAMSSGSPVTGALTLGTFALGTAPGLLGVGGLTSVIKGTAARIFFKTAGLVVILLAVFNISNGYNLSGLDILNQIGDVFGPPPIAIGASASTANIKNGVQVIKMDQTSGGYSPNSFTITAGVPVRWEINSIDPHSCAASIVMQKYNIRKTLDPGINVIEFTPTQVGQVKFTCSMGMYQGVFNVVAAGGDTVAVAPAVVPKTGGSCGGGGCGCGGGGKTQPVVEAPPSGQTIKAIYTTKDDIRPNRFTLKAGQPARFEVLAKDSGSGCMGSITVPGLTDKVDLLTAGKTSIFEFTPKAGNYKITCAMGVPRGEINVN